MNKTVLTAFSLAITTLACSACSDSNDAPASVITPQMAAEGVVYFDDFNSFDERNWTKESHPAGWVNNELQTYTPENVTTGRDGDRTVLILTAERKNGRITSGRINSDDKRCFKYGKMEASIKLPRTANGLWPAFWMMGHTDKAWPACGEIDIMEMGSAEGIANSTQTSCVNTAIHYGANTGAHEQQFRSADTGINLQDGNYHLYSLQWTPEQLVVSIDGRQFNTFDIAGNPYFHDHFYLIFDLAVGGVFTGISDPANITALPEGATAKMYVDWVKVYKQ